MGKIIFDRMYEQIAGQRPADKVLNFKVISQDGAENWKIQSIEEVK